MNGSQLTYARKCVKVDTLDLLLLDTFTDRDWSELARLGKSIPYTSKSSSRNCYLTLLIGESSQSPAPAKPDYQVSLSPLTVPSLQPALLPTHIPSVLTRPSWSETDVISVAEKAQNTCTEQCTSAVIIH